MKLFLFTHHNYDYDQLCEEIESIQRENESIVDFYLRLIQHSYRFHDEDRLSEEVYTMFRISLICKYFSEVE